MKGRVHPRVLLVEGKDELRTLPELLEFAGIAWPRGAEPVYIQEYEGVSNLLAEGEVEAQFKASGLEALGVLVDADHDPLARWNQVRGRLAKIVNGLPEALPPAGFIAKPPSGPRVGVWLMPDNVRTGMLETLLLELRRSDPPLQAHVSTATNQARALGAPFLVAHQAKAELHAWLAWQDPPGLQLHMGIRSKLLDAEAVKANAFLAWCRELYGF